MGLVDTLILSCRKASTLIERRELRKLGFLEGIGLSWHLRICKACTAYKQQSAIIDRWLEEKRDGCDRPDCAELQESVLRKIG